MALSPGWESVQPDREREKVTGELSSLWHPGSQVSSQAVPPPGGKYPARTWGLREEAGPEPPGLRVRRLAGHPGLREGTETCNHGLLGKERTTFRNPGFPGEERPVAKTPGFLVRRGLWLGLLGF